MRSFIKVNDPQDFAAAFSVSRETLEALEVYMALLRTWQRRVNLVGANTLDHIWQRHVSDSAQLVALVPNATSWIDLGSGAGFPGMVIAIMKANQPEFRMHLVESNARKCAFLAEVGRETGAPVEIVNRRIESVSPCSIVPRPDIVSARALAPLPELLDLAAPHLTQDASGLFPKGRDANAEIRAAHARYAFDCTIHPSRLAADSVILEIAGPVVPIKESP